MSTRRKLRLFVWEDVLVDYTAGVMFALAHDAEEARKMVLAHTDLSTVRSDLTGEPKSYDAPVGFAVWGGG